MGMVVRGLRRAAIIFFRSLPSFLVVSLFLLSFRSAVQIGTLSLTSFLHRDASVRSLLARLDSAPPTFSLPSFHAQPNPNPNPNYFPPALRRPDDGDDGDNFFDTGIHAFLRRRRPAPSPSSRNSSSSSSFVFLNRDGLLLRVETFRVSKANPFAAALLAADDQDRTSSSSSSSGSRSLGKSDAVTLVYLACLFSVAHVYAIVGFMLSYSCALGVVYVATAACLLKKRLSTTDIFWYGSKHGIRRLPMFLYLRWLLRDALTQLLCILFYSKIKDQYSLLKLVIKVKLMPFLVTPPSPSLSFAYNDLDSPEAFLLLWTIFDAIIAVVFAINCWVALVKPTARARTGLVVMKEGFYLLSLVISQAMYVKWLEMLLCWILGPRLLTVIGGSAFATAMQSVLEVYFMVVWLLLYFFSMSRAGEMEGRSFARRELEQSFIACLR